jgi:RHS repeat-associated protein
MNYDSAHEVQQQGAAAGPAVVTFGFDAAGHRSSTAIQAGATLYAWDGAGNLRSANGPLVHQAQTTGNLAGDDQVNFWYDSDGLRAAKGAVNMPVSAYAFDVAEGAPILVGDGNTAYVTGPAGLPIEQVTPANTALYYLWDQQGSVRAVTDQSGRPLVTYTYDPYGTVTVSPQATSVINPIQFAGRYTDIETGFQYEGDRYYDPSTYQYLNTGTPESGDSYVYVQADPINVVHQLGGADMTASAAVFQPASADVGLAMATLSPSIGAMPLR